MFEVLILSMFHYHIIWCCYFMAKLLVDALSNLAQIVPQDSENGTFNWYYLAAKKHNKMEVKSGMIDFSSTEVLYDSKYSVCLYVL